MKKRNFHGRLPVLLLISSGLLFGAGCRPRNDASARVSPASGENSRREVSVIPVSVDASPNPQPGPIAEAAARIEPAVVTIDTEYRPRQRYGVADFYGGAQEQMVVPRGSGSGVILNSDGYIVTNNHVVENATRIIVTLQNGRRLEGSVLGTDALSDLAVVKVNEKNLPAVTLADSDKVQVGEWVIAVGNPLGVGTTVTAGIVSAIRHDDPATRSNGAVIQTDAAINRGNSGGALADIKGRLIGINSSILSPNGGNIGIGFAIPSNTVREITEQLIEKGRIARPWLGIAFEAVPDVARERLGIPDSVHGVIVARVMPGSPADQAGIQQLDIIQNVNGKPLKSGDDMQQAIQRGKIGDKLEMQIWRREGELTVRASLQDRPERPQFPQP